MQIRFMQSFEGKFVYEIEEGSMIVVGGEYQLSKNNNYRDWLEMDEEQLRKIVKDGFREHSINQITLHTYKLWSKDIKPQEVPTLLNAIQETEEENKTDSQEEIRLILLFCSQISNEVDHNAMGMYGCKLLVKMGWKNLQSLEIGYNRVGPKGCRELSKQEWPWLTELDIGGNLIGMEGCYYLSLLRSPHLQVLSVCNNGIGPVGCRFLLKAFWPELGSFSVWDNNIGMEGAKQLMKVYWNHLKQILVWNNCIGRSGYRFLRAKQWKVECELMYKSNY